MKPLRFCLILVPALLLAAGCGDDGTGPQNQAPSAAGLYAEPDTVDPSGTSLVTYTVSDPDGDSLAYTWDSEDGALAGCGASVTWTGPLAAGTYEIHVTADDGQGHSVSDTAVVVVRAGTLLMQSREGLMAVGMDGGSFILYDAYVEVEVLGERIFTGPANVRELDHNGQDIGGPGRPSEVTQVSSFTILTDGGVAFFENYTDTVFFVSPGGEFLDAVQLPDASSKNQSMSGMVVGNDLIISETGARRIARVDLNTHETSIFKDLTQLSGWLGDIEYSEGFYYLTQWDRLHRFTEAGDPAELVYLEEGSILSVAVVGTTAFIVSRDQGRVYKVHIPSGEMEVFAEGFDEPKEIEYLPAGLTAP
jgi:hypothetical protein